jgi:hypothetical protein
MTCSRGEGQDTIFVCPPGAWVEHRSAAGRRLGATPLRIRHLSDRAVRRCPAPALVPGRPQAARSPAVRLGRVPLLLCQAAAVIAVSDATGHWWAAGEVPAGAGPFPAAPSPNDACDFHRTSLSGDYCASRGVELPVWMVSWQVRQTTRVLRRRRAICAAHAGCGRPGRVRSARRRTWCTVMPSVPTQISQRSARSRVTSSCDG